jgi:hypothetical protein
VRNPARVVLEGWVAAQAVGQQGDQTRPDLLINDGQGKIRAGSRPRMCVLDILLVCDTPTDN